MELNKSYFIKAAEMLEMSASEYLDAIDFNYAIICGKSGSPLCFSDGWPVIYGHRQEAMEDAKEEGDYIITERELLERFCHDEYDEFAQTREGRPSAAAKKMVAEQIMNMFDNNILNECGFESFIGWVEDGNTFYETYKGIYTTEQIEEAIALAKEITQNLDEISWKLNVEPGDE